MPMCGILLDIQTYRHHGVKTYRQTNRQAYRQKDRTECQTDRPTDAKTGRRKDICRYVHMCIYIYIYTHVVVVVVAPFQDMRTRHRGRRVKQQRTVTCPVGNPARPAAPHHATCRPRPLHAAAAESTAHLAADPLNVLSGKWPVTTSFPSHHYYYYYYYHDHHDHHFFLLLDLLPITYRCDCYHYYHYYHHNSYCTLLRPATAHFLPTCLPACNLLLITSSSILLSVAY